jgi:peptide/nickel transport system substrate-binding protein
MKRRDVLKSAAAVSATLSAPRIARADGSKTVNFVPHADLASIDPVWTTADITRNYSLAVFDTLYAYDAQFNVQPQMIEGHRVEEDGKTWELTLRDGLAFHDGEKVLARDCVATIKRFGTRNPFGQALMKRVDEVYAPSDGVIRFRLAKPFPLLPAALAQVYCAIMPTRLAETDPMKQIPEAIGSGPFKFNADERIPGSRVVYSKNAAYVPRKDGVASFNAGPKIVNVERVVWTFIPDPATASAALQRGEVDWWENPSLDLIPQIKTYQDVTMTVKDRTGEMGCLRFNHLLPPFDNPAVRRVVVAAMDPKEVREVRARHANGQHRRRPDHARPEGLHQAEAGPGRRRLQGREDRRPGRHDDPDHLGDGAGRHRRADQDRLQCRPSGAGMGFRRATPSEPGNRGQGRLEHFLHMARRFR